MIYHIPARRFAPSLVFNQTYPLYLDHTVVVFYAQLRQPCGAWLRGATPAQRAVTVKRVQR